MARLKAARPARPPHPARRRKAYHHGDLRRALVDAGLRLVEEAGAEAVNVREAARRAGVSPAAPFRHFPSRDALIAAIAAEAMRRFRREFDQSLAGLRSQAPLERLRAVGLAYLRWALRNPAHFEVLSTGRLFDHAASDALLEDDRHIRAVAQQAVDDAARAGDLRINRPALVQWAGRAMLYGFARMKIDGHFARWNVPAADAEPIAEAMLDLFIDGIARRPKPAAKLG